RIFVVAGTGIGLPEDRHRRSEHPDVPLRVERLPSGVQRPHSARLGTLQPLRSVRLGLHDGALGSIGIHLWRRRQGGIPDPKTLGLGSESTYTACLLVRPSNSSARLWAFSSASSRVAPTVR